MVASHPSTGMKHADSKTQAIRDLLNAAGRPLKIDELHQRIERKMKQIVCRSKLYTLLSVMIADGELDSVGRGDDHRFYWFRRAQ